MPERQGLLRNSNYEPPSVESARGSLDSLDGIEAEAEDEVRREMQQMDIEDPDDSSSNRSLLLYRFKGFSFTNSFPTLTLPRWLPTFSSWHFRIPYDQIDANRAMIIGRPVWDLLDYGPCLCSHCLRCPYLYEEPPQHGWYVRPRINTSVHTKSHEPKRRHAAISGAHHRISTYGLARKEITYLGNGFRNSSERQNWKKSRWNDLMST